ncbi:MAG: L,D-transpeptidase family protein, partial [Mesorhizobium sp.]
AAAARALPPRPAPVTRQFVLAKPAEAAPAAAVAPAQPAASEPAPVAEAAAGTPHQDVAAILAARFAAAGPDTLDGDVAQYYALRGNAPVWTQAEGLTPEGRAVVERLARAEEDGLDARDFAVPGLEAFGAGSTPEQAAQIEIGLSGAILAYAHQAMNGRVDPAGISKNIVAEVKPVDAALAIASVAIAADPAAALDAFNPVHPQYLALKRKLAELRGQDQLEAEAAPPLVPDGPTLKPGMSDQRVALLRSRLGVTTMTDSDVYDDALVEAVRSFQRERRLKANGLVGPMTVAALNGGGKPRISMEHEIIANMERWRWLPRALGQSNVFVNVPEYRLVVTMDGEPIHESRVIVGKPNTPTPVFSDTMEFVVLNPSWYVPQSIIKKEYLPKLANDPDYLARKGFVVTYRGNQMSVRQPPGDDNALGHVKFMFPNKFSVYLHDTSTRHLFASDKRAFSHGCVRVDNPYKFAEIVMGAENGWTEEKVRDSVGGRERRVDLQRKLPVHITYFTAIASDTGDVSQFDDIYGYDRAVLAALGLSG